ncbi:MAG: MFS transporter, partial [Sphingomonadales bacterium]
MENAGTNAAKPVAGHLSNKMKWTITVLLAACFTISYVDRQIISIMIDPIKDSLGVSDTQIGLMQGVSFSLFYVVASIPLAWLSDRGNRTAVMTFCVAGWSCMTMLCGFAATYWQLFLARIGVAVGEAGLPPAALTNLADMFEARKLALATSIFMLAPFIGGGIALIGGGALYAASESWDVSVPGFGTLEQWQMVFIIIGAPGLLVAAMIPLMIRGSGIKQKRHSQTAFTHLLKFYRINWRIVGVFALSIALVIAVMMAYLTWLPAAIMRSKNVDAQTIGTLFGPIYMTAGVLGTL